MRYAFPIPAGFKYRIGRLIRNDSRPAAKEAEARLIFLVHHKKALLRLAIQKVQGSPTDSLPPQPGKNDQAGLPIAIQPESARRFLIPEKAGQSAVTRDRKHRGDSGLE